MPGINKLKVVIVLSIFFVSIVGFFFLAAPVQAAGMVPCGGEGEPACNLCFLLKMLENVMSFLVNMVGIIAIILIVAGGSMIVASGTNKGLYESGKNIILNALIGTAIVLVAWITINTILTITGFTRANVGLSGNWFELQCSTATTPPSGVIPPPGDGEGIPPGGDGTPPPPPIPGGQTPFSCSLPCNNTKVKPGIKNWTESECNASIIAASSIEAKALIKAIMWKENGANVGLVDPQKESGHLACGPTQITPIAMKDIDRARFNDKFQFAGKTGDQAICEYLKSNPAEAVGYSAKILKKIRSLAEVAKQKHAYDLNIIELIAGGYNAGYPRNDQPSNQCGPGKPCNDKPDAQFKAPVPSWKCPYDSGCAPNTGFKETRNYTPDVVNGVNYFQTSCSS